MQTIFISDVVCRKLKKNGTKQPGRQLITFLLINNLTLWIIYTFEMQKLEASPVQLSVFGFTTWSLVLRITLPLSIFYRFHSAITFAEVWKNSYKPGYYWTWPIEHKSPKRVYTETFKIHEGWHGIYWNAHCSKRTTQKGQEYTKTS